MEENKSVLDEVVSCGTNNAMTVLSQLHKTLLQCTKTVEIINPITNAICDIFDRNNWQYKNLPLTLSETPDFLTEIKFDLDLKTIKTEKSSQEKILERLKKELATLQSKKEIKNTSLTLSPNTTVQSQKIDLHNAGNTIQQLFDKKLGNDQNSQNSFSANNNQSTTEEAKTEKKANELHNDIQKVDDEIKLLEQKEDLLSYCNETDEALKNTLEKLQELKAAKNTNTTAEDLDDSHVELLFFYDDIKHQNIIAKNHLRLLEILSSAPKKNGTSHLTRKDLLKNILLLHQEHRETTLAMQQLTKEKEEKQENLETNYIIQKESKHLEVLSFNINWALKHYNKSIALENWLSENPMNGKVLHKCQMINYFKKKEEKEEKTSVSNYDQLQQKKAKFQKLVKEIDSIEETLDVYKEYRDSYKEYKQKSERWTSNKQEDDSDDQKDDSDDQKKEKEKERRKLKYTFRSIQNRILQPEYYKNFLFESNMENQEKITLETFLDILYLVNITRFKLAQESIQNNNNHRMEFFNAQFPQYTESQKTNVGEGNQAIDTLYNLGEDDLISIETSALKNILAQKNLPSTNTRLYFEKYLIHNGVFPDKLLYTEFITKALENKNFKQALNTLKISMTNTDINIGNTANLKECFVHTYLITAIRTFEVFYSKKNKSTLVKPKYFIYGKKTDGNGTNTPPLLKGDLENIFRSASGFAATIVDSIKQKRSNYLKKLQKKIDDKKKEINTLTSKRKKTFQDNNTLKENNTDLNCLISKYNSEIKGTVKTDDSYIKETAFEYINDYLLDEVALLKEIAIELPTGNNQPYYDPTPAFKKNALLEINKDFKQEKDDDTQQEQYFASEMSDSKYTPNQKNNTSPQKQKSINNNNNVNNENPNKLTNNNKKQQTKLPLHIQKSAGTTDSTVKTSDNNDNTPAVNLPTNDKDTNKPRHIQGNTDVRYEVLNNYHNAKQKPYFEDTNKPSHIHQGNTDFTISSQVSNKHSDSLTNKNWVKSNNKKANTYGKQTTHHTPIFIRLLIYIFFFPIDIAITVINLGIFVRMPIAQFLFISPSSTGKSNDSYNDGITIHKRESTIYDLNEIYNPGGELQQLKKTNGKPQESDANYNKNTNQ